MFKQINLERTKLLASCPNCKGDGLYHVREKNDKEKPENVDVLVCRGCGLIIGVEDLKNYLWTN